MIQIFKKFANGSIKSRRFFRPCLMILTVIFASVIFSSCGNNNSGNKYLPLDSLGNKVTDSNHRGDTMYYERLQQKTRLEDTSSRNPGRSDTVNYERQPQRSNPRDSSY
ncbi:MAG TPA: hypothetical protein VGD17_13605 [Chitinophagaceae bacterium]